MVPKTFRLEDKLLSLPQKTLKDAAPINLPSLKRRHFTFCVPALPIHVPSLLPPESRAFACYFLLLSALPSTWKFLQISFRPPLFSVKPSLTAPPRKCIKCLFSLLSRTLPCLIHSSVSMPDPSTTGGRALPCSQLNPLPWCDE